MIRIRGLRKIFRTKVGEVAALDGVDLDIQDGEFFVRLGPSGSGKTTLLRCIAGLERPDAGELDVGETTFFSSERKVNVPPEERKLGMVFQSYAIWPHMDVFGNVALPLSYGKNRIRKSEVAERVNRVLGLVGLSNLGSRPAPLLSGGQQQRVALARAMAVEPEVMLMDEPLSNLDARLREEVRWEIHTLSRRMGHTVIYVTHDQTEAMALADRMAIMRDGQIVQVGKPEDLYSKPANASVAEFFGSISWIPGQMKETGIVATSMGDIHVNNEDALPVGESVAVGIRPEDIELVDDEKPSSARENLFSAEVNDVTFLGAHRVFSLKIGEHSMSLWGRKSVAAEGQVQVWLPKERLLLFSESRIGGPVA